MGQMGWFGMGWVGLGGRQTSLRLKTKVAILTCLLTNWLNLAVFFMKRDFEEISNDGNGSNGLNGLKSSKIHFWYIRVCYFNT